MPELGHILDFTSSFNVIRNITGQVNNFGYKNFELDLFNNFTKQFNELVLHHNTIIDYIDKSSNVTINTIIAKLISLKSSLFFNISHSPLLL